ncbi:hypothetical protein EK904_003043, partial [Melospiza melodia maxima]
MKYHHKITSRQSSTGIGQRVNCHVALLVIETQCKNDTEALITSNRRIISRREVNCREDEYSLDSQCCKKCGRGFVKNVSCPTDVTKHCAPCQKGKEFMDHLNDLDECFRCKWCDSHFGLEVVKNCTPEEDTQCACAKNHFCGPTGCDTCTPCTICESGVIEEQCTAVSDTVCGTKDKRRKKKDPNDPDVDLNKYIPGIIAEMTLTDVKKFVRHRGVSEPAIDQSMHDFPGDSSEQKIRLLQVWYQSHGMKGAYETLIRSLRELKMCAVADKIEKKLKAAISSSQEGGQSCNPDTEQSTQEGGNSYSESAEQSKASTASLEETLHR